MWNCVTQGNWPVKTLQASAEIGGTKNNAMTPSIISNRKVDEGGEGFTQCPQVIKMDLNS